MALIVKTISLGRSRSDGPLLKLGASVQAIDILVV